MYRDAVNAGRDGGREVGELALVVHFPLENARGTPFAVGVDLQAELGGANLVEGGRVELVLGHPQPRGIPDRDKTLAVPIEEAAGLGQADTGTIIPPENVNLPCADGGRPVVLDPLRAFGRPVAVRSLAANMGGLGCVPVVEGRQ